MDQKLADGEPRGSLDDRIRNRHSWLLVGVVVVAGLDPVGWTEPGRRW